MPRTFNTAGPCKLGWHYMLDPLQRLDIDEVLRLKPSAAKGRYMKKVGLASTMGPGVKIDPMRVEETTID